MKLAASQRPNPVLLLLLLLGFDSCALWLMLLG
jgi:hypothetical protein